MEFTCVPVGDQAISVRFAQEISPRVNDQVVNMAQWIRGSKLRGVYELIPAYASLLVYYDPQLISYRELVQSLSAYKVGGNASKDPKRLITIPALYGGESGPDLEDVAKMHHLTVEQVIGLHTSVVYRVYMLGFSPGFPYFGGLPVELHTPRLATPRTIVPAGSIGIAGSQTGIYSIATPGGWRIIAHTPVPLFEISSMEEPFLLRVGDSVRFRSIYIEEYLEIVEQVEMAIYKPLIEMIKEDQNEN